MPTVAVDSQGTIIQVDNGIANSPFVYVTIGGVTNIRDIRSGTGAEIDVTTLASTAKEFRLGLKDEGSMSMDMIQNPNDAGQKRLAALRNSRLVGHFKITAPLGSPSWNLRFDGIVTTLPATFAVDDVVRGTVTVRCTGSFVESGGT